MRSRRAEKEALPFPAALGGETGEVGLRLDAFGDDLHVETRGEAEDGTHDGQRMPVARQVAYERAVDLDLVEREGAQIAERGIAGSEVVHGDARTQRAQGVQLLDHLIGAVEQHVFSYLEIEALRIETGSLQRLLHRLQDIADAELHGRQIDRELDVRRPLDRVAAGPLQHVVAERRDEAGFLGEGYELGGRNGAARRVRPAQQGFEADDLLAAQIDQRLVMDLERFGQECRAQVDLELAARLRLGVHFRLEKAERRLAGGLGAVERHVGIAQQVIRIVAIGRRHGNADRRADGYHVALDHIWLADDLDEALREDSQLLRRLHFRHQHSELVAAEARCRIPRAQDAFDARGDILQQAVADRMAERVIDQLEVIEVYAQGADEVAGATTLRQGVGHALAEQHAIGQVGKSVVVRHVRDTRLGLLALGDVDDGDQHRRRALIVEPTREHDDLDDAAVARAVLGGADVGRERIGIGATPPRRRRRADRASVTERRCSRLKP